MLHKSKENKLIMCLVALSKLQNADYYFFARRLHLPPRKTMEKRSVKHNGHMLNAHYMVCIHLKIICSQRSRATESYLKLLNKQRDVLKLRGI